jgi:hypothetical protein
MFDSLSEQTYNSPMTESPTTSGSRVALVVLLLCGATAANPVIIGRGNGAEPDGRRRVLTVMVRDGETRALLPGAVVRVEGAKGQVRADATGTAHFPAKVRMSQQVTATYPGYQVMRGTTWPENANVLWGEVKLPSTRPRMLRGTVEDGTSGVALQGALVALDSTVVLTDSLGRFQFTQLEPRPLTLAVSYHGLGGFASEYRSIAGDSERLRIKLYEPSQTGAVAGRVIERRSGEPLVGASVVVNGTKLGCAAGADGRYVLNDIPPGKYIITFSYIAYYDEEGEVEVLPGQTSTLSMGL